LPRRRYALVFNARAGLALPRLLDGVLQRLRDNGDEVFQLAARSSLETTMTVQQAIAAGQCDAVLAAGGDGTFRAVARGVESSSVPVGFIPLGTGNVLAYELGLTKRARPIAETLINGRTIEAHGGLVNGEPFFLMVGAGFDAAIISKLNYRMKRVTGRAAFAGPVLSSLAVGPHRFDIAVDGEPFQASWVIVTRAGRYGGSFVLSRNSGVGRDQMMAVIIDAKTRRELLAASTALALGRLADATKRPSFVTVRPAEKIFIRDTRVPLEIDGDEGGFAPVEVTRYGPKVRVLVPPTYVADHT
jgi:diacylglycerol kinase (ATP)